MAARPAIAPLFALVPAIDDVVDARERGRVPRDRARAGRIRRRAAAAELIHAALIAGAPAFRERWGYRTDFRALLLTRGVPPPTRVHQIEYYQHLVRALGFPERCASSRG